MLNGLFVGSIYALIALGYTMVYGVLKLINFAHGEVFMVGAFLGWFTLSALRAWPTLALLAAMAVAMVGCAALGVVLERAAYRPLRGAPRLAALITAIGASLLLQNLGLLVMGASPKAVPGVMETATLQPVLRATGLVVNRPALVTVVAALLLMVGLQFLVHRTRLGRAMRAVSEDREAAQLMGVDVDHIIAWTFIIGSALAGAGGVLYALRYSTISPGMGLLPGLKAFVAAVLGGIGSIRGAMVGAMLIGVTETLVAATTFTQTQIVAGLLWLVMLLAFWRLGQAQLHRLGRHGRGLLLRWLAMVGVTAASAVVAGIAAIPIAAWIPGDSPINGSTYQDAAVFAVLVLILIIKPTGLMGSYAPEKV
ncbi:MAG: branched-chain amino acid ABC transporter permease [Armatimonadetes bacterium]|nr:branched-chain amino acid ABC transporter permease [Armatimonadota bacterium]